MKTFLLFSFLFVSVNIFSQKNDNNSRATIESTIENRFEQLIDKHKSKNVNKVSISAQQIPGIRLKQLIKLNHKRNSSISANPIPKNRFEQLKKELKIKY